MSSQITDGILRDNPGILPEVYKDNQRLFNRLNSGTRNIAIDILSCLSDAVGLKANARFENYHKLGTTTNCSLILIRYPRTDQENAFFGQNKHTDHGSLTILFANERGLEMQSPTTGIWGKVAPEPGHAVVNVGDMLRFLSGFRFKSAIHRVIPEWREGQQDRVAVGYFLRAEDEIIFKDNEGDNCSALEWHDRKYANYKAAHADQRLNTVLTGGMEQLIDSDSKVM
jgi:isopenicillin N synthase-like dioxygenase